MDPNVCLKQMLELAKKLQYGIAQSNYSSLDRYESDVCDLATAVLATDEWVKKGGVLPADWQKMEPPSRTIFSGDDSVKLWGDINRTNTASTVSGYSVHQALYHLACKCQELEAVVRALQKKVES